MSSCKRKDCCHNSWCDNCVCKDPIPNNIRNILVVFSFGIAALLGVVCGILTSGAGVG